MLTAGRVQGRIALVTGGAMGLGKADCERLAEEGATVIVTDIDEAGANAVAEEIGGDSVAMKLDTAQEEDWLAVYRMIEERFDGLDILVNNAGNVIPQTVEEVSTENFQLQIAIHVEGTFFGCKYGIPIMAKSGGGSIINMASMASMLGYSPFFAYSAAKGAVRSMTKSIAMHCQEQGYGIRCNVLMPGGIETPMVQVVAGRPGVEEAVPEGVLPAEALGAPSDVANLILYLASDESRFLTGVEIPVDNGLLARP